MDKITIPDNWIKIAEQIMQNSAIKTIFLIGECDTGKSTFAHYLVKTLSRNNCVGYLDCDPGQSVIGTPATLGLGIYNSAGNAESFDITMPGAKFLRFVGSNSPVGHLLENVVSIKKLLEKGYTSGINKVIIDSCGYIQDPIARSFQFFSIDVTAPDLIIEFYKGQSLKSLLLNFSKSAEIIRLETSPSVNKKQPEARKINREVKFKQYFDQGKIATLDISTLGLHGRIPDFRRRDTYTNLLVGLCNRNQFVVVLGIIDDIDIMSKTLTVIAPFFPMERIASIHFGSLYCSPAGEHRYRFKSG